MKWNVICQKGNTALLQNEKDTQFVVAYEYNPEMPEDEQWASGRYFCYWRADCKAVFLQHALEYFRNTTENDYIPRCRMEELATNFKDKFIQLCEDCTMSDDEFDEEMEELDLESHERKWFGLSERNGDDEE